MRVLNSISVSSSPSKMFILLRFLVVLATTTFALTGAVEKLQNETQAMMYLSQFGYLSPAVRNRQYGQISEDTLSKAIMEFQTFVGLNTTGILDEETLELMNTPRCGVKDKVGYATSKRSKRYALAGNLWRVNNLTYKISKYPRTLTKAATDETIRKAFSVWARVTPLTFWRKDSGPADIEIRFERGDHGDGNPFDGPGRTLAHAFYPIYGGDAHFDDSEQWTVNTYRGNNLFQVAVHEFGHSLGLAHSNVPSAVMAPIYRGYVPYFGLDTDDIAAVQALYRHRGRYYYYAALTRTELPKDAELCTDAKIDAIFNSAEGVTYAFKDRHYWKLTEDSIAPGYPKLISRSWPGLPGNIDAAFTYKNGKTYFFKESKYWRYTGKRMDGDYPKEISEGFTGIPDNVDATMVWGGNGKIYFFKGSKFWKFDPTQKPPVRSSYPKPISNWKGIPDNLDAVLQYTNGWTYFFKDGNYYRFNDTAFQVDNADPPFPRSAGYWWFGCRPATEGSATGNPSNTKEFLFPQLWFSKQGKQN